jgi:hypothetical protein
VVLTADIPDENLKQGDVGTVVLALVFRVLRAFPTLRNERFIVIE